MGWAGQRWLSYFSTGSRIDRVRVCLLSALYWLAFCLSLSFFLDVSVHRWLMSPHRTWLIFHLQPASQLLGELSTSPHAWTHSSAHHNISSSEAVWFFGESKDWCITCLCLYMNHLASSISLPAEFLSLHVCFFFIDWEEIQEWQISPDAIALPPFCHRIFVWESMLLFNICPTLYCYSQEQRNKKPLFSCRGCNSMLSEPIVFQRLHLFLSCIVYWCCGSGRSLNGHNYAASHTSETAFPTHGSAFSWSERWGKAE